MQDLFAPQLDSRAIGGISSLGLAHIGDAVYEIMVRTMLITNGHTTGAHLHQDTVALVCAPAQSAAVERILPLLTPEELGYFRRGRNANVKHIPKNATHGEYALATGLEALFGALYLLGRKSRLSDLFSKIMEDSYAT